MSDETNTTGATNNTLSAILDGNVREVTASLDGLSGDELVALLEAENSSDKPRRGVTTAIEARLEPDEPDDSSGQRTAAVVAAELAEAEDQPVDIIHARRIQARRAELSGIEQAEADQTAD